jgi:thermitase
VDLAHPDLNLWPVSYSTITHTNNGSPVGPHGTACSGIIAGRINSGTGVAGLAGDSRVMAISTFFSDVQVAEGLYYAADNGARVVSMSFGVYPSWGMWNFAIIQAALQYCQDKNVVLVAASGNEDLPQSRFPGSDPRTICVGGSNRADERKRIGDTSSEAWWGACYGPDLDVVAPCLEIPTTDELGAAGYTPGDYELTFNGTSSATPHVAAVAALILSSNPSLTNGDVRQVIAETTDKINGGVYVYLPTGGKPYGTWTTEVGYGRVNVERALLVTCASNECKKEGPCGAEVCEPEPCCVSPCDPPWRPDAACLISYEERYFRLPLRIADQQKGGAVAAIVVPQSNYIEFRVTYEHRMCLLGKQHGPLLYTTTLLPGETVRLYHSDRYRRVTSTEERYSVQTTFMQSVSMIHQAHLTNSFDSLQKILVSASESGSVSAGAGLDLGFISFGGGGSSSSSSSVSSESMLAVHSAADVFEQSVQQASQLTHAERSVVVSTFEDRETQDITVRQLHNANECRAVTYFVRQVVELYALSVRVTNVSYRIVAPNIPDLWHNYDDLQWLPPVIQNEIRAELALLPRVGDVVEQPRPFSLPTDGTVYDPELAHCCSCEPERAAAIQIRLDKEKAEALKVCFEAQQLEAEVQRRRLLLAKGDLSPFTETPAAPAEG